MVTLPSGATVKSIGSDQTSIFWAMVTFGMPEKDRALSEAASIVLSTSGDALQCAMCAESMVTEPLPCRLENCTRRRLPPIETCTTWRSTLFESDDGGWLPES